MKAVLDKGLGFLASKKLLMATVSTVALFTGHLDGDHYMVIMAVYTGGQSWVDRGVYMIKAQRGGDGLA